MNHRLSTSRSYWIGKRPNGSKKWSYTTSGMVLDKTKYHELIFRMYRRYVKQWNDIELNLKRCLSEHTHEIHGAKVFGGDGCIILHWKNGNNDHWVLEIYCAQNFSIYYPGWSCGRNPFRSLKDIRSANLHWSSNGREEFDLWLDFERVANKNNGEWDKYRPSNQIDDEIP